MLSALKSYAQALDADVLEKEPMARHTTFQIGGPAGLFIEPHTEDALAGIAAFCEENDIPVLPLGKGSNLLIADEGFPGAVLSLTAFDSIACGQNTVTAGAGAALCDVCAFARDRGLAGLAFAYGIPGSLGGAVYMNAGAYGGEMSGVIRSVRYLEGGKPHVLQGEDLAFGYRRSPFTSTRRIVTGAVLALTAGDSTQIARDMEELMERRRSRQPLEYPSAGSVFMRPPGHFAGTLIESCGLKGTRVGGAMVSEKHAGFIVNTGGATCRDVQALIEKIQSEVYRQTGVSLQSEVRVIGRAAADCNRK